MRRVLVVVSLCLPACASGPLSPVKSHTPPEATPPAPKTELAQAAPPGRAARPPRPGRLFDGIERPERAERGEKPAGPHILIPDWGTRGERARSYDLNHIRFAIDFDLTKRHIRGRVTNVVAPFTDDLKAIELDAEELHILSARIDGRPARFTTGKKSVQVALDRPARAGVPLEVTLEYEGTPRTGLHWVGPEPGYPDKPLEVWSQGEDMNNHFWLPMWDYPNDRTTWESFLTVPAELTAVSNGSLVGVEAGPRPGTRTFHYKMAEPNVTYLIAVAVGPWERYADAWQGRPVEYFVPRGTGEVTARRSFGQTPDMIDFFSKHAIGVDYPWPKYAQTAVAEFVVGGMENVSSTLQTDLTLHDERWHLDQTSESLVAHELAHQWFGDLLTCRSWDHLWLNEAFATYFEVLYAEHLRGRDELEMEMWKNQTQAKEGDDPESPQPLVQTYFTRTDDRPSRAVYSRGSSVLHMLRFVVGDARFRRVIQHYVEKNRGRTVDSEDLRRSVAEVTGQPLEWFFQEWVYGAGVPELEVSASWDPAKKQEVVVVKQTQKVGGAVPYFRMPVDIALVIGGKKELHRVWMAQAEDRFELPARERPQMVRFDDGGWILKTLKFDRSTEELSWQLANSDHLSARMEAIDGLGEKLTDERATEALTRVLGQPKAHWAVRARAAEALAARKKSTAARKALLSALEDPEARVRTATAKALGSFNGDQEVALALQQHLQSDRSYATQAAAVHALGQVLGKAGFDVVASGLAIPSQRDRVGTAALETMAEIDPGRALPRLLEAAAVGKPYPLRMSALSALARASADVDGADKLRIYEVLDQGLRADYYRARLAALRALGQLGGERAQARLERAAKEEIDPGFRRAAQRLAEQVKKGVALKDENTRLKRRVEELEKELRGPG
ncbi:MAG TPA: M1 family aminopeptidase, partial [Polyangia bacterium]|nr:M1 family aminopeptidase [Polyangia bacterium]